VYVRGRSTGTTILKSKGHYKEGFREWFYIDVTWLRFVCQSIMSIKISFPDRSEPFIQLFPRIFSTIYIFVCVSATGNLLIVYMFRRMQQKFARCLKVRIMASFIFIIQYSKLISPL
jgi:hypothetical protein